jgi:hypothetical protein
MLWARLEPSCRRVVGTCEFLPTAPQDLRVGAGKASVGQMPEHRHFCLVARQSSYDDHRVVHFRPRRAKVDGMSGWRRPIHDRNLNISSVLSLARYERDGHEDDYRQRMIMNGLAFLATVALIAIGVWLAANIDA